MRRRERTRHPGIYYRTDTQGRRRYIVWFRDSEGKERFETLPLGATEKDAVEYRASVTTRKARGERVVRSRVTVKELGQEWLATKVDIGPRTRESYEWALDRINRRLGIIKVSDLSVDDVASFIEAMRADGLKAWSIRKLLTVLGQMLGYAQRRKGIIAANPVAGLLREEMPKADQKAMRILSSEEIEELLGASSERWGHLWRFLLFTGLRISEALSLEWQDVDFEAGLIHVRESKTKAGVRSVVLTPSLAGQLRRQRLATPALCKYVFHTGDGKPLMRRNTLRALRGAMEGVTQHELRHTYASILIGQGMDVTYVANQMGHADPSITLKTYAKLFDPAARRDEAREKLEAVCQGVV